MPQLSPMNWMYLSLMSMLIIKSLLIISYPQMTTPYMTNKKFETPLYTWTW